MSLVSRLKARLGLDTAEFSRGVDQAKRDASGLGGHMSQLTSRLKGGLVGMVAGLGITSTVVAMRDLTRSIANVGIEARRAGLDTTAFQQLSYVAQQNRIDVDVLVDGMKELNMRVDEFVTTGGGSAADALMRLGYRASDLARGLRKPDELFMNIIGRIKDLDRAAQLRMLDEIFGGSAGERFVELLDDGADGIKQMMREATDLGLVMDEELIARADELDRKWDQLTQRAATFFKTVAVGAADAFEPVDRLAVRARDAFGGDVADEVADAGAEIRAEVAEIADDTLRLFNDLAGNLDDVITGIQQGALAVSGTNQQLAADFAALAIKILDVRQAYLAGQIGPQEFATQLQSVMTEAEAAASAIDEMNDADLSGLTRKLGGVLTVIELVLSRAASAASAVGTVLSPIRIVADTEDPRGNTRGVAWHNTPSNAPSPPSRPADIDFGVITPPAGGGSGGGSAPTSQYLEGLADLRAEIAALQLETEQVTGVIGSELPYALEKARKQAELLAAAQAEGRALTPALRTEVEQLADAYAKAGHEAEMAAEKLEKVQENGKRGAEALSDVFMAAMQGAGNAKQAVAALLAQLAQSYMLKGIMGFGGSGLPGSGLVSGLGAILGSNANGTPNWRGGLTTVHERGGEIMNLPRGTQIIPNDISKRMADAAGKSAAGGGHMSIGFDASTGSLTATMFDVAGRVVARESSAIIGQSVSAVQRGSRKTSKFLGA